jgi:hypothetical protein
MSEFCCTTTSRADRGVRSFADELRRGGYTVAHARPVRGKDVRDVEDGMRSRASRVRRAGERGVGRADGTRRRRLRRVLLRSDDRRNGSRRPRRGARGALLMYSCLPVSEFGDAWPRGPVQVHGKEGDEFSSRGTSTPPAPSSSRATCGALPLPGQRASVRRLVAAGVHAAAAALLTERVLAFLERSRRRKRLTPLNEARGSDQPRHDPSGGLPILRSRTKPSCSYVDSAPLKKRSRRARSPLLLGIALRPSPPPPARDEVDALRRAPAVATPRALCALADEAAGDPPVGRRVPSLPRMRRGLLMPWQLVGRAELASSPGSPPPSKTRAA